MSAAQPPNLPPGWPAATLARLPAWVAQSLPPAWWSLGLDELAALPEKELIAIYRATRASASRESRLAAQAMILAFRGGVERLVEKYAPPRRGPGDSERDQELLSQGWTAFFAAVENYDPAKKGRLLPYAAYTIKEELIKQLISTLPQAPHSDDTRKAWDRTLARWAELAQERGQTPNPDEVAEALAPELVPAIATVERARKAIRDVFRVLTDNRVRLDEPDDDAEEPAPAQQAPDSTWDPARLLDDAEQVRADRARLDTLMAAAAASLGSAQEAGKLLAVRILLNLKDTDQLQQMDFGFYKIKAFINEPTAQIVERWAALWIDYHLGRYGLPRQWDDLRQWFDPPVEVAELRAFLNFSLDVTDWNRPAP